MTVHQNKIDGFSKFYDTKLGKLIMDFGVFTWLFTESVPLIWNSAWQAYNIDLK